jgi:hypothetical protein
MIFEMRQSLRNPIVIAILAIVVIFAMTLMAGLFTEKEFSYETICAVIGVILTAAVTGVLLSGQTKQEEIKEKNSKRYEAKLQVYQAFLKKLCDVIKDRKISDEEVVELYFQISNLAMHSEASNVTKISADIQNIVSSIQSKSDTSSEKNFLSSLFRIVSILKSELYELPLEDVEVDAFDLAIDNLQAIGVASDQKAKSIYDRIIELKRRAASKLGCNRQWVYNYHTLVHECYVHDTSLSCDCNFENDGSVNIKLFIRSGNIDQFRKILSDQSVWGDLLSRFDNGQRDPQVPSILLYKSIAPADATTDNLYEILVDITNRIKKYQAKVK